MCTSQNRKIFTDLESKVVEEGKDRGMGLRDTNYFYKNR